MNLFMDKNWKPLVILIILVIVSFLAVFWAINYFPITQPRFVQPPYRFHPRDIEVYYTLKTVISTINATLLVSLFVIYADIYRKVKAEFTIGLMIFTIILLLYALSSNPIIHWIFGFRAFGLGPFAMLPDLFTCVALIVLLYLVLK
ncbi:MAG: hypothetical protein QXL69_00500 [Candidatus Bathyarchaeia archaeon]